jgi:Protein of unknown function (DUF2569)
MEPDAQRETKSFLPGIRGGLIVVLLLLVLQFIVFLAAGWIKLFGFGDEIGYLEATSSGGLEEIPPAQIAYIAFDILQPFLVAAYAGYVLYTFLKTRRTFPQVFLGGMVLAVLVIVVDGLAYYSLFGELPDLGRPGSGVVISLGVYQYLITSPRAKATFVS